MTKKVNLIFKKREGMLVSYLSVLEGGGLCGVGENYIIPKYKVLAPDTLGLRPLTNYRCEVREEINESNGERVFIVVGATKITYNTSVILANADKNGNKKIVVQIQNKTIFLDPINGKSPYSQTLSGAIRAINMMPNNFDKQAVINQVTDMYNTHIR